MHQEAAVIAFKPFIIAAVAGLLAAAEPLLGAVDVQTTFEAIGIYGLPTVLVVYFIARDWFRERENVKQLASDKEALARLTESDKQRSHEARVDREREAARMIAAERDGRERADERNHQLQMALIDHLNGNHLSPSQVASISDSSTGKFLPKQGDHR